MVNAFKIIKVIVAILLINISRGLGMDSRPYRMQPWDEILGQVLKVEEQDGRCLAVIGKISVYLPISLAPRLRELQDTNTRVGVLRSDKDFRLRAIPPQNTDAKPNPVVIVEDSI